MRWFLLVSLSVVCQPGLTQTTQSLMKFVNNGYERILVGIHPDTPENVKIIDEIKAMFTSGSSYLYKATKNRAYFRNVTVLIPSTWKDSASYKTASGESFVISDVRVDTKNPVWAHNPYTRQTGRCGEPGHYIHLTPEFVMDKGIEREYNWGDTGRVLVHEFSHLRYGVFDEYGIEGDSDHPLFYLDGRGRPRPTGCATNVRGYPLHRKTFKRCAKDKETGLPENDCRFFPELDRNRAKSSIMFLQFIETVDGFCEHSPTDYNYRHNTLAPNMQNKMCDNRGTWDVIKQHNDFTSPDGAERAVASTVPTFQLVYPRSKRHVIQTTSGVKEERFLGRRLVLTLDLSGSMHKNGRIFQLRQAVGVFIRDVVPLGTELGIVTFSTNSWTWLNMTVIHNASVKEDIIGALPQYEDLNHTTAIGKGLLESVKLLKANNEMTPGSIIILVTDGEENVAPYVQDVLDSEIIQNASVIVHTLGISSEASTILETISTKTNGMSFYYSEGLQSAGLISIMNSLSTDLGESANNHFSEVMSDAIMLANRGSTFHGTVTIDEFASPGLEFLLTYMIPDWPHYGGAEITVEDPDGNAYSPGSAGYTKDEHLYMVRIKPRNNEPGTWQYTIKSTGTMANQTVHLNVLSRFGSQGNHRGIKIRTWVSAIKLTHPTAKPPILYADVTKDKAPVVNATVHATIERPGKVPVAIRLYDNGAGADNQKYDGVYSAYFTNFSMDGRYSIKAKVTNDGKASVRTGGGVGSYPKHPNVTNPIRFTKLPRFTRTTPGSSMQILNIPADYHTRDYFPPSRITNLRVLSYSYEKGTITLRWTAPGNNFDQGKAIKYEMVFARNLTEFQNNRTTVVTESAILRGSITPRPASQDEVIVLKVTEKGEGIVYFIGVRTFDGTHWSQLSNTVTSAMEEQLETKREGLTSEEIGGIIGGSIGGLLIICATVLAIYYLKTSALRQVQDIKLSPYTDPMA